MNRTYPLLIWINGSLPGMLLHGWSSILCDKCPPKIPIANTSVIQKGMPFARPPRRNTASAATRRTG